jgi:signal transduction histidine kinase
LDSRNPGQIQDILQEGTGGGFPSAPALLPADILFSGGGELGARMRQMDWSKTSLGSIEGWPQSLRTCVRIILTSRQPMFIWWGDDLINLYNDAYRSIVGGKHPHALGQPASLVWREIWDQVGPRAESAMRTNEGTYDESLLLIMERYGYREETYYTFSYSPVPNDQGGAGGILCANTDDTERIIGERRVTLLRELASRTADARTWLDACRLAVEGLSSNPIDIVFALIYVLNEQRTALELASALHLAAGDPPASAALPLDTHSIWPVEQALRSQGVHLVRNLNQLFPNLPRGAWDEPPNTAAVLPLTPSGSTGRAGAFIVGLNPYRPADDDYLGFLKLVAGQISASIANAEAWEQERRRAEALAELDRAKTIFFSNVSHEFRTPLTLMLGPLEEMLDGRRENPLQAPIRQQIATVHRNGLRLLKLVNTLLDFSRIEAGRVQAVYRPVDLAARTADLASLFRSAMDRAGLTYTIDCPPLPQPVYVDLEMWEKVVLNLISNAFKFTLSGTVEVSLHAVDGLAVLSVRDTGTGIPESELPRIFERFHRIEGTAGRTHEGTGIGLALVEELVRLHGGAVEADSRLGQGTVFRVTIPFGFAHLPPGRVGGETGLRDSRIGAAPFVQEALRWLPGEEGGEEELLKDMASDSPALLLGEPVPATRKHGRVLLADDNRDMREYVQRLLSRRYEVQAVSDGAQALIAAIDNPPDLVLTDIMMPALDGFALLRELRANGATATIPVIMLSARAGEEAESEGLEAGADDYLVKPFTARELLARVGSHVSMHRIRRELVSTEHELRVRAETAETQYRAILESISEGFVFVGRNWQIQHANAVWAGFAGKPVSDLLGADLWTAFPGLESTRFGEAYRKSMDTGEPLRVEDYYEPLRRWFHVNVYPSVDGISLFAQDVTDQRLQRDRLLLSEKLAATGRLAATIAHEINNPLESVLNLIYLARTSHAEADRIQEFLTTAEKELHRVAHIARHTLGFYRETSVPAQIDLTALLSEVLTVSESRFRSAGIEIRKDFVIVPTIQALRGEMHQVFSNLFSNAIDAMRDGGTLTVSLRAAEGEDTPGLAIRVADTGTGIPPENLDRLFEPFFTTKPNSGTGLGLWVVRQFVESWGGRIQVSSTTAMPDRGTSFNLFIPLVPASRNARPAGSPSPIVP